ncbi:MAG: hypothetical protein EA424_25490 [Planctomycetaceae bacterium]|nr:MAG: hypothetical protein EA424_25490 [Planctomycetaceae bacterium]
MELFLRGRLGGLWPDRHSHAQRRTLGDRQRRTDHGFFLYYVICAVHSPLTPDERFQGKSWIGPFGDCMMEFDWAVGRVMAKLDLLGVTGNTWLIVTSDNSGVSAGEPGEDKSIVTASTQKCSCIRRKPWT